MVETVAPFWPASVSNIAWLLREAGPGRIGCAAPCGDLLAKEISAWSGQIEAVDLDFDDDRGKPHSGSRPFDTLIVMAGGALPAFDALARRLAPGGQLLLLVPRGRARRARLALRRQGLRVRSKYLVAESALRPLHWVPDRPAAVRAWLGLEAPAGPWVDWVSGIALRLGWRPRAFGARLLVATRLA